MIRPRTDVEIREYLQLSYEDQPVMVMTLIDLGRRHPASIGIGADKKEDGREYKFTLSIHASFVRGFVNDHQL